MGKQTSRRGPKGHRRRPRTRSKAPRSNTQKNQGATIGEAEAIGANPRRGDLDAPPTRRGGSPPVDLKIPRVMLDLATREQEYQETKNPLYVWSAIVEAIDNGVSVPAWALRYLRHCAHRLLELRMEPPREVAPAVAEALEFKRSGRSGRGNVFRRFEDERDLRLAIAVALEDGKVDAAYDIVAQANGVHRSTVARAWRQYRTQALKIRRSLRPSIQQAAFKKSPTF